MTNWIIRDYIDDDYEEVLKLWEEVGLSRKERRDSLETIRATIDNGGKLILLIDNKRNYIIGTSWLTVDYRRIYLQYFSVKKEYQGQGLAHILLDESYKYAKKMNLQVKLEVRRTNLKAISLYKNSGFTYLGDYDTYIVRNVQKIKYHNKDLK